MDIVSVEFDPNIAIRVLLNIDLFYSAMITAYLLNLVLYINEKGRVFTEINSLDIKHIVQ